MTHRYAENTQVPADRSRSEIERILTRYGATAFSYGWDGEKAVVRFVAQGRMVQFRIPMPDPDADEFWHTPARRTRRSHAAATAAWQQASNQRWRALKLAIQAKLEAVTAGIATFDEEFLTHLVLPDGRTVGQFMLPQVQAAYEIGTMPSMLALPRGQEP